MAETHAVSGLKAKKEEIRCRISELENDIKACRSDLVTISEALRIMGDEDYAKPEALFGRGELAKIIFDALRDAPDGLEIKALADVVMKANGLRCGRPRALHGRPKPRRTCHVPLSA
jgi:hypothetical protein